VLAATGLLSAPSAAVADCPDTGLEPTTETLPRVEAALVCLMNEARRGERLATVRVSKRLERSSAAHTADMVARGYFAHHRDGRPPLIRRIARTGYFKGTYTALFAENLGYGPPERANAATMHHAFMLSDAHRHNVLYGRFRHVGIGTALTDPHPAFYEDYPAVVFTVDFGRRYLRRTRRRGHRCLERSGSAPANGNKRAVRPRWVCPSRGGG
jgi:uncharacterized protein YkwD